MSKAKEHLDRLDHAEGVALPGVADGAVLPGHARGGPVRLEVRGADLPHVHDLRSHAGTRARTIAYRRGGRKRAAAFVHRGVEGLRAEVEFERTTGSA